MSPKGVYKRTKRDSSFRPLKPLLEELYIAYKLSTTMIAEQFGVSPTIIKYWMRELEIPRRGHSHPIHSECSNGQKPRLYRIWESMKSRCTNPNRYCYEHYGGKGVRVYFKWLSYSAFKKWAIINGYADNLTIDRIDNNGNYEPNNCQWITMSENVKKGNEQRKK